MHLRLHTHTQHTHSYYGYYSFCTRAVLVLQGRSPTCVTYVEEHSARAPTSSHTAVSTGTTGLTHALAASTVSSTETSCGSTRSTTAPTADSDVAVFTSEQSARTVTVTLPGGQSSFKALLLLNAV